MSVTTGGRSNNRVEILDGVTPGTRIVTEGVVKLAEGMKVTVAGEPKQGGGAATKGAAAAK